MQVVNAEQHRIIFWEFLWCYGFWQERFPETVFVTEELLEYSTVCPQAGGEDAQAYSR